MRYFFLFILSITISTISAQKQKTLKIKKYQVAKLSDTISENSGLTFFQNSMYTINDGGNPAEIYQINHKSGKIQNIFPTKLENKDWEAITADSTNIYVADFGNNLGNRKDLAIYKIPFHGNKISDSVKAIKFYYPEQTDFSRRNINNDHDAEALIFLNGKLHLFSKEWVSKGTAHYVIDPDNYNLQAAEKKEYFDVGYVVTDAAYHNQKLYLVGYTKNTEVFLTIFNETKPGIFFESEPKRYYLGSSFSLSQIEGVEADEQGVYISGESFTTPLGTKKPTLYYIPHRVFK